MMNIPELIKEAHENAISHGFYPEGENKNIGSLLMGIVSELGEAYNAHRAGKFPVMGEIDFLCNIFNYKTQFTSRYNNTMKHTFPDEIADTYIRLFSLCGYLGIDPDEEWFVYGHEAIVDISKNVPAELINITEWLIDIKKESNDLTSSVFICKIGFCFAQLNCFCKHHNIPIEKHIKAKQAYNRTRPHKHGKEY